MMSIRPEALLEEHLKKHLLAQNFAVTKHHTQTSSFQIRNLSGQTVTHTVSRIMLDFSIPSRPLLETQNICACTPVSEALKCACLHVDLPHIHGTVYLCHYHDYDRSHCTVDLQLHDASTLAQHLSQKQRYDLELALNIALERTIAKYYRRELKK